ncbi:hypothetical protein [Actinoplanes sp. NBRC 103695]|uniref:hypothetical protein n=1 Tax=Actinoplanes sp. NBRC 103695 TaxID=3032202 RepID=UPI0024A37A8C|nr:hypothetical protein [Actinoplanes sp. NBRC 103695]GLY93420.1 hypothetical protein Acsp02_06760 [Actinoplanes sp. NBRC 103695]
MTHRFFKRRRPVEDLVRDADYQAGQAKRALGDDAMGYAIRFSDWTVTNTREVVALRDGDSDSRGVLADRLWDRALIRQALGDIGGAIGDASEALAILGEQPTGNDLLLPSLRMVLCELHAQAGDTETARRHGQAIAAYEGVTDRPEVVLADGFGRYGRAMHLIGDAAAGPALRRAAGHYRAVGTDLGGRRTVMEFIRLVLLIADTTRPVTAAEAPAILGMLRDAEAWARRLPQVVVPVVPVEQALHQPAPYEPDVFTVAMVQQRIADWLQPFRRALR